MAYIVIAIQHVAELDVGKRKIISREKGMTRHLRFGDVELLAEGANRLSDCGVVPVFEWVRTTRQNMGPVKLSAMLILAHSAYLSTCARQSIACGQKDVGV